MDKFDAIKSHFEEEAKEFDEIILRLIPNYKEMVEALVISIPFNENEQIKVIDLGCGTGTIAKAVKERYPNAQITCLDLAENMITMSKIKLSQFEDIDYIVGDFSRLEFDKRYDVIISSLALHHLVSDDDKKDFYRKIFEALNFGGVFYNADVVTASNSYLQDVYMNKWKKYMMQSVSQQEVDEKWIPKYKEEDRPTMLMNHLEWLKEIGFKEIDVIWKYYNYSVYGGYKK